MEELGTVDVAAAQPVYGRPNDLICTLCQWSRSLGELRHAAPTLENAL